MKVYKHYDQQQLNFQYNTRLNVPDYTLYFDQWEKSSRDAQKRFSAIRDICFGDHPGECLDVFPAGMSGSKTVIFIHGGYWHLLDKALFHFLSSTFLYHNITAVYINYRLAPAATIDQIVTSCGQAVKWVHNNITRYNGNPSELYVLGHSAGGHLASMLLTQHDFSFLKGVVSLSGLFHLEPVMLSYLNEMVRLDVSSAARNSPVFLSPLNHCPLLLITGADESHEFKSQSTEFYKSWKRTNSSIEFLEIAGKNHYSILDTVTEENSLVQSAIFRLMNIKTKQQQ